MIEIKKPTTFTEGTQLLWSNELNCYDQSGTGGDETTFGYQSLNGDDIPSIRFHTWETKGQTYTATVLKLKWKTSIQTGDDKFGIEYTKNGGSNWNDLVAMGVNRSSSYATAEIALDANQDLSQVEVRVNSDKIKGPDNCDLQISDIWTEGTYTEGATFPVNQIVSKITMLAVTVLAGGVFLVSQPTAKVVPYNLTVKSGQPFIQNLQTIKVIPYSPTIKNDPVVSVNRLITEIVPYPITVQGETNILTNLLINKVVPINLTVGNAKIQINQSVVKLVPYSVTVIVGSGTIPVNLIINKLVSYPLVVTGETKDDVIVMERKDIWPEFF